jgi:hypothetical protein
MTACAHRAADLQPQPTLDELSTAQAVEQATSVDVTEGCADLTKDSALPHDYLGKNVYVSRKEWKAAAEIRQKQLTKTGGCIADTHNAYAKGLPR